MSHLSLRVFPGKFLLLMVILAISPTLLVAQDTGRRAGSSILDDTTRNVYGPHTSRWTTEQELFENRPNYRPLDTLVTNYHRWTYVQRFNNFYKDLGVMGTAMSPIFPVKPATTIGANSGFTSYEPYWATEEPVYFDTKSPYTKMKVIWGGIGRALTRIEFSRNINPRWNLGFNYRPILVDKQPQHQKSVRQTVSHYYDFFMTYKSKDERYGLLFNFRRIRHRVNENGGLIPPEQSTIFDPNASPTMVSAQTEDYRRNIHLLHQYQLVKAFQVYHIADITKQENTFRQDTTKDSNSLFDRTEVDSVHITDVATLTTIQNEFGIKGNVGKLFYAGHMKIRSYEYNASYLNKGSGVETYVGGQMSLAFDSLTKISGSVEYLLPNYYRIEGRIESPWLEGYFANSLSKPGFMQTVYRGSHDYWVNSFSGVSATQAQGFLKFRSGNFQFWGGGTFNLLHNYVYFQEVDPTAANKYQRVLPMQSTGFQSNISPEIRMNVPLVSHVFLRPQVIYTLKPSNDDNVLQIPDWFVNVQFAYEHILFNNHLQMQAGVDVHYQSTYAPLGYDPAVQQFYVQKADAPKLMAAYPLVDIFVNAKMRRARLFLKYHNVVQAFTQTGYIITPAYPGPKYPGQGYPGQMNVIDFGFEFLLFD